MNLEVNNLHNFTFTYSVLNEISLLLEHVLNICSSFKIDLKEKEEIVRVDEFHRYDRSLFLKTVKDPRLFTLANSSPFPKSLYQNHYEENVDTYENRFIKYLLISLKEDIESSYKVNEREKLPFLKAGISYGNYGTFSLLTNYVNYLNNDLNENEEINTYALSLLRRISLLLTNDFFKRIKEVSFTEVYATNILLHDKDYAYAYTYYIKNKENSETSKKEITSTLLCLLLKDGENVILKNEEHLLSFKRRDFEFAIDTTSDLNISLINLDILLTKDYKLRLKVNLFSKRLIVTYENEEYKIDIKSVEELKEFIYSLATLIKAKEGICPLCKKEIEGNHCSSCSASFALIHKENLTFAWIFNIFAVILEGDSYEV